MIRFYGEAPGHNGPRGREAAFLGSKRLIDLAEVPESTMRALITFRNLLDDDPRPVWPRDKAARRADEETESWRDGDRVVLAGVRVCEAFDFRAGELAYFRWHPVDLPDVEDGQVLITKFPHPSGLNRFWNDPANVHVARVFMRNLVEVARS